MPSIGSVVSTALTGAVAPTFVSVSAAAEGVVVEPVKVKEDKRVADLTEKVAQLTELVAALVQAKQPEAPELETPELEIPAPDKATLTAAEKAAATRAANKAAAAEVQVPTLD